MKKIIPCSLKRLGLLFLVLVAFATNSSYAQCNASAEPRFVCAGPGNNIIYTTASVLLDNGTTLTWTITGDSTGGARFVNNNSLTSTTTVSSGLFNSVAVLLGPLSGSTEVRMSLPGDPPGTGCAASVFTKVLVVQGSATPVDCPNDLTTVSITPGLTGTKLGTSDQIIQFPSLPGGCGQYTYNLVTSPGGVIVATNNTGIFPNVTPQDYVIRITDCDGCTATSPIIDSTAVDPRPLIVTCPVEVDRPACASQIELEGIFQAWLATFQVAGGFPPVITVRNPDGIIVPLNAPNHCGGSVTVTWNVRDNCGYTDTCTRTFLVRDSLPPVIVCAPGENLGCNPENIPGPTAPQITSACPTLPYTYEDVVTGPMCARILTRTYTVTNECNQSDTCEQIFTYKEDHVAPMLFNVPVGRDLGCNPVNLPACDPLVYATDNCDEFPVAECSRGTITNTGCNYRQVITYSSMDSCGNRVSQDVIYTWKIDTTAPVVTCPPSRDLGCNPATPGPEAASANDNCDGDLPVTAVVGDVVAIDCLRRLVITYSATDECGNVGSCEQILTWTVDLIAPVIELDLAPTLGNDPTLAQILLALGTAHIVDACGATLTFTDGPVIETEPCHFTQTRTWSGIDNCLNRAADRDRTVTWTTSGCAEPNGCTLGYWKNHTLAWDCYSTCTLYKDVFTGSTLDPNLTLLQALNLGGGACNNLARQSVAALLNICDGTLDYSVADVAALQTLVNAAFANGTCGAAGSLLDGYNNEGGANHCDVVKSPNTTQSTCTTGASQKGGNATGKVAPTTTFKVYPNPFTDTFSINSSNTVHPINVSIFDVLGRSVDTRTINSDEVENISFGRNFPTGMYNIILNQATETKTLRVIKQ